MQHQHRARATGHWRGSAIPALLVASAACGGPHEQRHVAEVRVERVVGDDRTWGRSSAERFGFGGGAGLGTPSETEGSAAAHAGAGELVWSTPAGWSERPPSAMRQADWQLPDGAECYLSVLPGGGGGLEANVQRWRGQLSLPPATPAELAALPRARLLGQEALLVDFTGTFVGMGGGEARAGQRLLGLLALGEGGEACFLKLVGPAARVELERERFLALAASLRRAVRPAPVPAVDPSQAPPAALQRAAGLAWEAPAGWVPGAERSFRVVTFHPSEHPDVECYVTLLLGAGGGLEANVERWRGQLGTPQEPADVAERGTLSMLGGEGAWVEIQARAADGPGLLGAVRELGDRALFVKLVGPRAAVRAERERFLSFCASLREEAR